MTLNFAAGYAALAQGGSHLSCLKPAWSLRAQQDLFRCGSISSNTSVISVSQARTQGLKMAQCRHISKLLYFLHQGWCILWPSGTYWVLKGSPTSHMTPCVRTARGCHPIPYVNSNDMLVVDDSWLIFNCWNRHWSSSQFSLGKYRIFLKPQIKYRTFLSISIIYVRRFLFLNSKLLKKNLYNFL